MKSKLITLIVAVAALLQFNQIQAQNRISSPYSRFGIGELFQNTHVNYMSMGGISRGIYNPYFVNVSNPASYSAFDTLSFVFDVSLHGKLSRLSTASISQTADYASLGNLLFGFPVTKWWRASFGLLPYSGIGYKITDHRTDSIFNNYNNVYEGEGGINRFYIGSGFEITRNLSVGVNVSYLFGTMNRNISTQFPDSLYRYNSKTINSSRVHDLVLDYGIMYHKEKANGFQYTVGASFFTKTNVNTNYDRLTYTYTSSGTGVDNRRDTIELAASVKEKITLPTSVGAGFSLGKTNKWLLGADVSYTLWDEFKYAAAPEALSNNMQLGLGGFYNPSTSTVSNYFSKVTYRAGLRYSTGYLELRGQQIDEFGISFGVGLPLPRTSSTINLGFEIGSRGTEAENLIQENYVKFTLGLSIFERWFIIRKYQ